MVKVIKLIVFIVTIVILAKCAFSDDESKDATQGVDNKVSSVSGGEMKDSSAKAELKSSEALNDDANKSGSADQWMRQYTAWQRLSSEQKNAKCNAAKADCATAGNINQCLEIRHKMEWTEITTVGCGD